MYLARICILFRIDSHHRYHKITSATTKIHFHLSDDQNLQSSHAAVARVTNFPSAVVQPHKEMSIFRIDAVMRREDTGKQRPMSK